METKKLSLTCIMIKDPKLGGYTAFFKQFPNIISEGETTDEAIDNLMNAIHDVFEYQNNQDMDDLIPDDNIIQKPINFTSLEIA